MKNFILILALSFSAVAFASEQKLILQVVEKDMEENVISKIELYSSNIDPNRWGDDTYRLEIDGKEVKVPGDLLFDLYGRTRSHRYDMQSDGIITEKKPFICYMRKFSTTEYNVRYLTYEGYEIIKEEMKTVYNNGLTDCTEDTIVRPKNVESVHDIRTVMAILDVIKTYSTETK